MAIKGIVPEENQIIGEYLQNKYHIPLNDIVVISGPCHVKKFPKKNFLTLLGCQASENC